MYNGFFMHTVSMRCFFIRIVSFRIIFSMKGGYVYVWERVSFADMLFNVIINVTIFLVLKGL